MGKLEARDVYTGRESMNDVKKTKYLGDIIKVMDMITVLLRIEQIKRMEV